MVRASYLLYIGAIVRHEFYLKFLEFFHLFKIFRILLKYNSCLAKPYVRILSLFL